MIELKDLLGRWSNIILTEEVKRDNTRRAIEEVLKISIDNDQIKVKKGVIYLNIRPIYKNEILLKKNQILAKLEEFLGAKAPKEIR